MDSFRRVLFWLFVSSAGAATRVRIVRAVKEEPRNAQQLSVALELDYTTVRHHLRVLVQNHLLDVGGERYGQVYFLAGQLEQRWTDFEELVRGRAPKGARSGT